MGIKIVLAIPVFNGAKHIPNMRSLIEKQTIPFDTILCFNDGSTDNTWELLQSTEWVVARGDANRGAGFAARQQLLEMA
jgi:glycosyltransferase involved in cell wall biosynthesis